MKQYHRASTGDTVTVPDELAAKYDAKSAWEPGDGSKKSATPRTTKKETD